jgi:hypothetical protein
MKGRHDVSRIIALSLCVIVPLSLAEFPGKENFGHHLDSGGRSVPLGESDVEPDDILLSESDPESIFNPHEESSCIATVAMLQCPTPRRFGPMDAGSSSLAPDESGPGSSAVLRI